MWSFIGGVIAGFIIGVLFVPYVLSTKVPDTYKEILSLLEKKIEEKKMEDLRDEIDEEEEEN